MSNHHLINVLNKTFVREFYRMNSGFFLLIGTLAFGFMSQIEHIALAQFFVGSSTTLTIPLAIWMLYTVKVLRFNSETLRKDENRFVFNVQFLPLQQRIFLAGTLLLLQLLPAVGYALFLIVIAWPSSQFTSVTLIVVTLVACIAGGVFVMTRSYLNPYFEERTSSLQRSIDRYYIRPVLQYYVEWMLRMDPILIGGTKVVTGALLFGVCALYRHETYDMRLMAMAVTAAGIANVLIVFRVIDFEHERVGWMKSLPIPLFTRYIRLLVVVVIFLIPEVVILIRHVPGNVAFYSVAKILLYLVSLGAFLLGFLHTRASPPEYYTTRTFWIFIALVLAILFSVSLQVLSVLSMVTGYVLFKRSYYRFERDGSRL